MVDGATTVVAAFFLSSVVGVAAELLYHVARVHADLHPSSCMLFAGSSAGVAGLGGALAGFMLINWEEAFAAFRFAYGPSGPCGLRTLLLLLAALYAALEIATIVRDPDNGVANVAHLGGLAFGALYAFGGGRNVVSRLWETTARVLAGLVAFAALAAVLVLLGVRMGEWTAEGASERCFAAR
jgi:membrane associated rhomboid family serine protease